MFIEEGTVNASTGYILTTNNPITVGTTGLAFAIFTRVDLATWPGSTNITTLGTIGTGTWEGTAIGDTYISSASTWNAKADSGANTDITSILNTSLKVGRDTDNFLDWSTDNQLDIRIGATTTSIQSISTGTSDNDKLVTKGYVDDNAGGLSYITESYNTTYDTVKLLATYASDPTVGIALETKAMGAITVIVPDGTAIGGNARGQYSIDLQKTRTDAINVASANNCSLLGGNDNKVAGNYGVVCGGSGNNIESGKTYGFIGGGMHHQIIASYDTIGGGDTNIIFANHGFIGGGNTNTIDTGALCSAISGGNNCTINASVIGGAIGGGYHNTVGDSYGVIPGGRDAKIENFASMALAFVDISSNGDAQTMVTVAKGTSTNGSEASLLVNGDTIKLPSSGMNKAWAFKVQIVALDNSNSNANAYWLNGLIKNIGGTTSMIGIGVSSTAIEDDTGVTGATITADDTNDALKVTFQGKAETTWDAVATIWITQTFA